MPAATAMIECREVPDNRWELLLCHLTNQGGEYLCFAHKDTPTQLLAVVVCPRCKMPGRCGKHKVLSEKPLTLDGAFLCMRKLKGGGFCGYRAVVRDGLMREV